MGLVTTKLLKTSEGNFKRKNPHNFLSDNSDLNQFFIKFLKVILSQLTSNCMKTLISILLCLFLANCYSYKNITFEKEIPNLEQTKVYEIILKNNKRVIAKDLRIENENYIFKDKKERENTISIDKVLIIKERKFSYGKTIGLIAGSAVVVLSVAILVALSDMRLSMGEMHMPP